jgi:uncharacterized membrane protein (UPF0136 family)
MSQVVKAVLSNRAMSVAMVLGGLMGFRAGSKMSLVAGAAAAYMYHTSATAIEKSRPGTAVFQSGHRKSFTVSVLLGLVMLYRFLSTRKIMPSGLVVLLTAGTAHLNYKGMTRSFSSYRSNNKPKEMAGY